MDDPTTRIPRPRHAPAILRFEPPVALPAGTIQIVADEQSRHDERHAPANHRLEATRHDTGLSWAHEQPGLTVMALWQERQAGKGEDAHPTFLFDPALGVGLLATYDGTGGSGSALVTTEDGEQLSGAFLAARLARRSTEAWFARSLIATAAPPPPEVQLHDDLERRFGAEAALGLHSSDRFAGSLRRELPTTLAATAFHATADHRLNLASLWAGDSRCHLLTPTEGLQQLTLDDSPVADALEAIVTDAPMTNVVCADRDFRINRRSLHVSQPAMLLSATDGAFGYVATPAHYEYLLLQSLLAAASAEEWAAHVLDQLDNFTGDDASLVLAAFGWSTFAELQEAFRARTELLQREHWTPFIGVSPDDREQLITTRTWSWQRYQPSYERHLPRPDPSDTITEARSS